MCEKHPHFLDLRRHICPNFGDNTKLLRSTAWDFLVPLGNLWFPIISESLQISGKVHRGSVSAFFPTRHPVFTAPRKYSNLVPPSRPTLFSHFFDFCLRRGEHHAEITQQSLRCCKKFRTIFSISRGTSPTLDPALSQCA